MPDNKIQVVGQIPPDDMTIVWQAEEDGNFYPRIPPIIPGVFDARNPELGVLRFFRTAQRATATESDIQDTDNDVLTFVDPASPATVYLTSTSVSDTGVNAPVVVMTGCDAERRWWISFVTLNGQTPVEMTSVLPFNTFMGTPAATMAFYLLSADVTAQTNPAAAEPLGDVYISSSNASTGGVPDDPTTQLGKIIQGRNRYGTTAFVMPLNYYGSAGNFALTTGSKEMEIFVDVWFSDDHRRSFIEFILQGQTVYPLGSTAAAPNFLILGRALTPVSSSTVSMSFLVFAEPITP